MPLDSIAFRHLPSWLKEDSESFSAMRRQGTPDEVAEVVCWLALENTYMSGKAIPVNGGI